MSGKLHFFEDVETGARIESAARTVTESDVMTFAGLSGDYSPLHVDEEWAKANTPFGGRIAHGLLITAISYALRADVVDSFSLIGWMEVKRRFLAPVRPGDTVRARWTVDEARLSRSRPGTGVVTLAIEVVNQRDEVVQDGYDVLLVHTREHVAR
ncbi:MAG: MaoC family dehydratase N-terminal domain-containing protein [Actinobacteria bacterium]|nr:MaoC family dehydratase N-terminal domain-containing protein [Actinomycetota bacterium]